MIFDTMATMGHEEVVFCHNKDAGLTQGLDASDQVVGHRGGPP